MDSMPLSFDLPQEDELAILLLNGGISYYMPLYFMSQEPMFRKYLSFNESSGCTIDERNEWKDTIIYLIKKIILKEMMKDTTTNSYRNKRLILKSPVHTARVDLLRSIFPKAKFIYIHRDPYEVVASSSHMADTTYWYTYLNTPTNEQISEFILYQFQNMFDIYNKTVVTKQTKSYRQINTDTIEISYKSLVNNTRMILHDIYDHLDININDDHYSDHIQYLQSYKVNTHSTLTDDQKKVVYDRWCNYFTTFKYNK